MTHLTITLDEDTLERARSKALEEGTSVDALLRSYLGSIDNPELVVYRVTPNRVRYMEEWALKYYEVPAGFDTHA